MGKSFKVYPGDKVKIEAYAKYSEISGSGSDLTGFASTLLAAFGQTAPAGGETGTPAAALNSYGGIVAAGGGVGGSSYPKIFVNILVFDKSYNFLDIAYEQIDGGAETLGGSVNPHDFMSREYTAKQEGYVYLYVSNESATQVDAYFDDVVITRTPTNIIQYNEYYPFGLNTEQSWTRENVTGNNYQYNESTEKNPSTGYYDLFFRNFDPVLGRFMQVDPLASKYHNQSTYQYGNNDPVYYTDPSGAGGDERNRGVRRYSVTNQVKDSMFGSLSVHWSGGGEVWDQSGAAGGLGSGMMYTSFVGGSLASHMMYAAADHAKRTGDPAAFQAYGNAYGLVTYSASIHPEGIYEQRPDRRFAHSTSLVATLVGYRPILRLKKQNPNKLMAFKSGNYADDFSNAERFMRDQSEREHRFVVGLELDDRSFVVLPTEGYLYKGRRLTNTYEENGKYWSDYHTNFAPFKRAGKEYRVKVNEQWHAINKLIVSIPNVDNYYKSVKRNTPKQWLLPWDFADHGRVIGAETLRLLYDRPLGNPFVNYENFNLD